jgi:hypothetical protein
VPQISLDAADAGGLARDAAIPSDWLGRDPSRLAASLEEFVGHVAYGTRQLSDDLDRFVFLLGGSDGESLFGAPRR